MVIKSFSEDYADVYIGLHHFSVEKIGDEFIIEEIHCAFLHDSHYIATVATMQVALDYLSAQESFLD